MTSSEEDRLVRQFEPACVKYAGKTHVYGMEYEDVLQELRLAVLTAIRHWVSGRGSGLTRYVIEGIKMRARTLEWSAIRAYNAQSRRKYASSISLQDVYCEGPEGETLTVGDTIADTKCDPCEQAIAASFVNACFEIAAGSEIDLDILCEMIDRGGRKLPRGNNNPDPIHKRHGVSRQSIDYRREKLKRRLRHNEMVSGYANDN